MALIRRGLALLHIVLALWFSVLCPATQAQPQAQAQAQAQAPGATILTDENYDALVTSSSDLWLLEFYAPWCGHCKRLRPILDELAQSPSAAFPMKVGVMDATREQAVPGKFGIKSFPTIKFFKDGVYGKYEGPRTLEAFQKFGERMHGPAVTMLPDVASVSTLYASSQVVFLFTYEGEELPTAFAKVAKQMQAEATFAAVRSVTGDGAPSLAKLESGQKVQYMMPAPNTAAATESSAVAAIEEFVKDHNHPLLSALDSHNFKQLGSLKRMMVIAIVDYKDTAASQGLIRELEAAASAMAIDEADRFVFGHLDGVQWKIFAKQYDATVTSLLLLDLAKDIYHTTVATTTTELTSTSIAALLASVVAGTATMKKVPAKGFFTDMQKKLADYYPYSLLCLVPVVLVLLSFIQYPDDTKKTKNE